MFLLASSVERAPLWKPCSFAHLKLYRPFPYCKDILSKKRPSEKTPSECNIRKDNRGARGMVVNQEGHSSESYLVLFTSHDVLKPLEIYSKYHNHSAWLTIIIICSFSICRFTKKKKTKKKQVPFIVKKNLTL